MKYTGGGISINAMKGLAAAGLFLLQGTVLAQAWPAKPILMLSATGAGNPGDVTLRAITPKMGEALGQPFIIDMRPGASGTLAITGAMKAQPDGYTLLFGTSYLVGSRFLLKDPPFDVLKDLTPVSFVIASPSVFAIHPSIPANNLREFIAYAKANPGKLSYVHTGEGLALHLIGQALNQRAGIDLLTVGYKASGSNMVNDFVSGRVPIYFPGLGTIRPFTSAGKAKLIAVWNGQRLHQIPDVPTVEETLPGIFNVTPWFAFLGPAGLPRPIADRVAAETKKALNDPQIVAQLDNFGVFISGSTPDEFAAKLRYEIDAMGKLFKSLNLRPE
jgi:tripartite-type tricarboxylate transporter receptor subunit TctC